MLCVYLGLGSGETSFLELALFSDFLEGDSSIVAFDDERNHMLSNPPHMLSNPPHMLSNRKGAIKELSKAVSRGFPRNIFSVRKRKENKRKQKKTK